MLVRRVHRRVPGRSPPFGRVPARPTLRRRRRGRVLLVVPVVVFHVGHRRHGGRRRVLVAVAAGRLSRGRGRGVFAVRRPPPTTDRLQRRSVHVRGQFRLHRVQLDYCHQRPETTF